MSIYENQNKKIPEYYDGMHRDGYTADQILYALRRKMVRSHYERQEPKESQVWNVKITSEVKIK